MILDEVAKLLADNSTALTVGTNLFKGFQSPSTQVPDTATFIHESPGRAPQRVFNSSAPVYEIPHIQIIDRSTDYETARNSAENHYRFLQGQANTTFLPSAGTDGAFYLTIEPLQSPFLIGRDENDRFEIGCNFEVMKMLSS